MTGRHSGLGWPGAIGDQARDATAAPYIGKRRAPVLLPLVLDDSEPCCVSCGHRDGCDCPHHCTYPEDTP